MKLGLNLATPSEEVSSKDQSYYIDCFEMMFN